MAAALISAADYSAGSTWSEPANRGYHRREEQRTDRKLDKFLKEEGKGKGRRRFAF
jgi:hypothetical protein